MKVSFVLSILSGLMIAGAAHGQVFFLDNFDNTTGTNTNLNDDLGIRQSGSYVTTNGTVNWAAASAGTASRADYQNRLSQLQTDLQSLGNNGRISAYLDQDFAADLTGSHYSTSFSLGMELFTGGGNPNQSTAVGDTTYRLILANSAADVTNGSVSAWDAAVSFSPFYDGTDWQMQASYVIDGATTIFGNIGFTPVADGPEWQAPTEDVVMTIDEVANTVNISYGSTTVVSAASLGSALGSGRYIGLQGFISGGAPSASVLQHELDNFKVTIVPEPSLAALVAGVLAIGFVAYRRRRS